MMINSEYPTWFDYSKWGTPRWRTAITRPKLSTPMEVALGQLLKQKSKVLDFGCGHGQDAERLNQISEIEANGFDPYHCPDTSILKETEIVTLIYVLNSIESAQERLEVLEYCWQLTKRALVVAVRTNPTGEEVTTRQGTFQKFFQVEQFAIYLSQEVPEASITFPRPGIAFLYR